MKNLFKLELDVTYPIPRTITKRFNSLKVLRQWTKRNNVDNQMIVFEKREYIFTGKSYERFAILGKTIVPLSDLIKKTTDLINNEEQKASFLKK
jgi:hypothetical protein